MLDRSWERSFERHNPVWDDAPEINIGPPYGARAFNPSGSIPLPAAADGDVTVFEWRVPPAYDAVILGQYHAYIPSPLAIVNPFVEGSGDIEWRVWVDGRYAPDCGQMIVQMGTTRGLSPIAGGIQLRSNNLVRYVVYAPNSSGVLSAGLGSISAGLHGYLYPRL